MKKLDTLLLLMIIGTANAATYQVGQTKPFLSPNALYLANAVPAGDTIEIDGETYSGTANQKKRTSTNHTNFHEAMP